MSKVSRRCRSIIDLVAPRLSTSFLGNIRMPRWNRWMRTSMPPSPWIYSRRWLQAGWIQSPGTGTGFWRRSRERLWAGGISRRAGSRDGPSPLSYAECGLVEAGRWWKLLQAGWLDPDPSELKLHRSQPQLWQWRDNIIAEKNHSALLNRHNWSASKEGVRQFKWPGSMCI